MNPLIKCAPIVWCALLVSSLNTCAPSLWVHPSHTKHLFYQDCFLTTLVHPLQALPQALCLPSQDVPKLHEDVPPSRFAPLLSRCGHHLAHTHNLHESLSKLACALHEQVHPSSLLQTLSSHFSSPYPTLSSDEVNNWIPHFPYAPSLAILRPNLEING